MPVIIQLICEDQRFDFECESPTDLRGRLLWSEAQRQWLLDREEREDEAGSEWYLDEHGDRLPEEELFRRSPWALAGGVAGEEKLLGRFMDYDTGEAFFQLLGQYGGEWMREIALAGQLPPAGNDR